MNIYLPPAYEHFFQSPLKRLEALEQIRRKSHQYKYNAEPIFQRFYTIIKR